MTHQDLDLAFALKMYGEKMVAYALDKDAPGAYEGMCFWQNQAYMCAQAVAVKRAA